MYPLSLQVPLSLAPVWLVFLHHLGLTDYAYFSQIDNPVRFLPGPFRAVDASGVTMTLTGPPSGFVWVACCESAVSNGAMWIWRAKIPQSCGRINSSWLGISVNPGIHPCMDPTTSPQLGGLQPSQFFGFQVQTGRVLMDACKLDFSSFPSGRRPSVTLQFPPIKPSQSHYDEARHLTIEYTFFFRLDTKTSSLWGGTFEGSPPTNITASPSPSPATFSTSTPAWGSRRRTTPWVPLRPSSPSLSLLRMPRSSMRHSRRPLLHGRRSERGGYPPSASLPFPPVPCHPSTIS